MELIIICLMSIFIVVCIVVSSILIHKSLTKLDIQYEQLANNITVINNILKI